MVSSGLAVFDGLTHALRPPGLAPSSASRRVEPAAGSAHPPPCLRRPTAPCDGGRGLAASPALLREGVQVCVRRRVVSLGHVAERACDRGEEDERRKVQLAESARPGSARHPPSPSAPRKLVRSSAHPAPRRQHPAAWHDGGQRRPGGRRWMRLCERAAVSGVTRGEGDPGAGGGIVPRRGHRRPARPGRGGRPAPRARRRCALASVPRARPALPSPRSPARCPAAARAAPARPGPAGPAPAAAKNPAPRTAAWSSPPVAASIPHSRAAARSSSSAGRSTSPPHRRGYSSAATRPSPHAWAWTALASSSAAPADTAPGSAPTTAPPAPASPSAWISASVAASPHATARYPGHGRSSSASNDTTPASPPQPPGQGACSGRGARPALAAGRARVNLRDHAPGRRARPARRPPRGQASPPARQGLPAATSRPAPPPASPLPAATSPGTATGSTADRSRSRRRHDDSTGSTSPSGEPCPAPAPSPACSVPASASRFSSSTAAQNRASAARPHPPRGPDRGGLRPVPLALERIRRQAHPRAPGPEKNAAQSTAHTPDLNLSQRRHQPGQPAITTAQRPRHRDRTRRRRFEGVLNPRSQHRMRADLNEHPVPRSGQNLRPHARTPPAPASCDTSTPAPPDRPRSTPPSPPTATPHPPAAA